MSATQEHGQKSVKNGLTLTPRMVQLTGRATISLGSNLGQVVYTHCLPSFSAPRNRGTKGSFQRLSGYGD